MLPLPSLDGLYLAEFLVKREAAKLTSNALVVFHPVS
jgi:hypothetical protein